jgi:peroxiredoxin (alkyl hydroperoxide reductase subunit C)
MSLGRDINEYLRLIDAYTHVQTVGEVCPANWKNGAQAIKEDIDSLVNYLKNI